MAERNYESQWWGYIYDQMMTQDLQDLLNSHLRFYRSNIRDRTGSVLECACGTGLNITPSSRGWSRHIRIRYFKFDAQDAQAQSKDARVLGRG